MRFYFPLVGEIFTPEEDSDYDSPLKVFGGTLSEYQDDIQKAFRKYNKPRDMSVYFGTHTSLEVAEKLVLMLWNFVDVNYELFGRVDVILSDDISDDGIEAIKEFITGQNSDGLGEGFEQTPIKLDDGRELFVSMWSRNDYYVDTEEEFVKRRGGDPDETKYLLLTKL